MNKGRGRGGEGEVSWQRGKKQEKRKYVRERKER
jgi:hypothetical protein